MRSNSLGTFQLNVIALVTADLAQPDSHELLRSLGGHLVRTKCDSVAQLHESEQKCDASICS